MDSSSSSSSFVFTIALIPKNGCTSDIFFEPIYQGCVDTADELSALSSSLKEEEEEDLVRPNQTTMTTTTTTTIRCVCVSRLGYYDNGQKDATQGQVIADLTQSRMYQGLAVAVLNETDVLDPIHQAIQVGLPVVTVDSDAPNSRRLVYIGTNNTAMGFEMARILLQIRPTGGNYVIVTGTSPNLQLRTQGIRQALKGSAWQELTLASPLLWTVGTSTTTTAEQLLEQMADLCATGNVQAMLPVLLSPMRNATAWRHYMGPYRRNNNVTFVGTDWTQSQLELLRAGYVHGLMGQLPYDMGNQVARTVVLAALSVANDTNRTWFPSEWQNEILVGGEGQTTTLDSILFGTNLIEMVRVPLLLPPIVDFDHHYLGRTVILGYTGFGLVAALALALAMWTWWNRSKYVVRASQPTFLYIICTGVLLLSSSVIVLSMDDQYYTLVQCNAACVALPWLFNIGFVLIFSALFSKTWRINRLFHQANKFKRLKVTTRDVILPLLLMLTANIIILLCWTLLHPVQFIRRPNTEATDLWNRVVASTGTCRMPDDDDDSNKSAWVYLSLLGAVNGGALVTALYQAYQARDIQTEFAESRYIALVFAAITEAALVGGPVLAMDRNSDPVVFYVLAVVLTTLLCTVILVLMFGPKIWAQRERDCQVATDRRRIRVTGLEPSPAAGAATHLPARHNYHQQQQRRQRQRQRQQPAAQLNQQQASQHDNADIDEEEEEEDDGGGVGGYESDASASGSVGLKMHFWKRVSHLSHHENTTRTRQRSVPLTTAALVTAATALENHSSASQSANPILSSHMQSQESLDDQDI